ncbi:MAG: hypothetical protein AAFX99_00905, partial [Myxococcota bacterium]
ALTTMFICMVVKAHDEVLKKGQTTRENIEHKQVTILATDTLGQVTQAKVVYTELVEIRTEGEQSPQRRANPLSGKTYIATLADGAMTIKDAQGADVPSGEADEVIAGNGDLLQPNTLHKLIPQGAIAVGTKLPIEKALLAQLFELDEPGALEIEEAWMILREVREIQGQRAGVFETELTLSAVIDKLKMSFDLSGQLSVALANGHLVELTLDGPVRFTTPQDPQQPNWVELEGHGSITMHKQLRAVQP